MKDDVRAAVLEFFETCYMPAGSNSTIVTLVPKSKNINTLADFRPISYCNVVYKCISTTIANK